MRIALVSEHASPLAALGGVDAGGQNVHVASLATGLAAAGHRVEVYTRRDGTALPERVPLAPGVDVVHVPAGPARHVPKDELLPWIPELGTWMARRWIDDGPPDVVHAHFWMSGLAAVRAVRSLPVPVPVVQTFHALGSVKRRHQGASDTSPTCRVESETALGRAVDLVVATCSDEVAELVRLGIPRGRIQVVPCGVDLDLFRPAPPHTTALRTTAGEPPGRVRQGARHRLLSLGRLVERKGVATVVEALADLPGTELLVAGGPAAHEVADDPEARRLTALAERLGCADRVRFVGSVGRSDVPALIRSVDVVVATPWYEPFGIVPLESAACGVPVVGSAVGGLRDSVDDGVTGVLVPPRDPAALAGALRALLDDPGRRRRMGAAARQRAVERYGWDCVARDTLRAYATVLAAPGAGGGLRADRTAGPEAGPAVGVDRGRVAEVTAV